MLAVCAVRAKGHISLTSAAQIYQAVSPRPSADRNVGFVGTSKWRRLTSRKASERLINLWEPMLHFREMSVFPPSPLAACQHWSYIYSLARSGSHYHRRGRMPSSLECTETADTLLGSPAVRKGKFDSGNRDKIPCIAPSALDGDQRRASHSTGECDGFRWHTYYIFLSLESAKCKPRWNIGQYTYNLTSAIEEREWAASCRFTPW
jgi:hypothetical protein